MPGDGGTAAILHLGDGESNQRREKKELVAQKFCTTMRCGAVIPAGEIFGLAMNLSTRLFLWHLQCDFSLKHHTQNLQTDVELQETAGHVRSVVLAAGVMALMQAKIFLQEIVEIERKNETKRKSRNEGQKERKRGSKGRKKLQKPMSWAGTMLWAWNWLWGRGAADTSNNLRPTTFGSFRKDATNQ